jgi:hypothetical protein
MMVLSVLIHQKVMVSLDKNRRMLEHCANFVRDSESLVLVLK